MQTPTPGVYTRVQKSCAECRRRKQKCIPPSVPGTQCANCVKRWPPVQCVFPTAPKGAKHGFRSGHPGLESIFVFSAREKDAERKMPRAVGGVLSAVNCLNSFAVEDTMRNAELMNIFLDYVCPNLVSIDGQDPPVIFRTMMLPWMMQSPLFPTIAILMASVTQALEMSGDNRAIESFAIKAKVLSMINKAIGGDHDRADILRCVIHLVITEWFWGDDESMWAHLRGLRDLVTARGGIGSLNDPLFLSVLILADYAIACCFEKPLSVQGEASLAFAPPAPATHSTLLASPLREYDKKFTELQDVLSTDSETAKLLDDIRFLTVSITSLSKTDADEMVKAKAKIKRTASFIHDRVKSAGAQTAETQTLDTDDELIAETISLAAFVYSKSIMSMTPMTQIKSAHGIEKRLYTHIKAVSSKRWKKMPGIFLWLMLVAVAQVTTADADGRVVKSEEDVQRKILRRKLGAAAQAVGQEEFGLSIVYLRAFWLVQRWVADG